MSSFLEFETEQRIPDYAVYVDGLVSLQERTFGSPVPNSCYFRYVT